MRWPLLLAAALTVAAGAGVADMSFAQESRASIHRGSPNP